jgi:hypothetical protein
MIVILTEGLTKKERELISSTKSQTLECTWNEEFEFE